MHTWMDWCAYALMLGSAALIAFSIIARSNLGVGGFVALWAAITVRGRRKSRITSIGGGLFGAFFLLAALLFALSPPKAKAEEPPADRVLKR